MRGGYEEIMYERELEIAVSAAQRAGELALRHFSPDGVRAEEKDDLSPVTMADRECEKLLATCFSDHFPEDGLIGEEGAFKASRSGRRWLIDPIDGTRDFVRGTKYWSTQIALQAGSQVVLGIVYLPLMGELAHATLGGGCYCNGEPARPSGVSRLDQSILTLSSVNAVWDAWGPDRVRFLTEHCWTVRAYSACYDVIMLMRGKTDIWLSGRGMEWDYAAARIMAGECGARFLTRDGSDRIDERHCVICVPGIEREIRQALDIPDSRNSFAG
jgi:histidinol-phosphatase